MDGRMDDGWKGRRSRRKGREKEKRKGKGRKYYCLRLNPRRLLESGDSVVRRKTREMPRG
jgi:hypothetical protein